MTWTKSLDMPRLGMSVRNGARIPFFFAGYLRQHGSWGERISGSLCLLTSTPEESVWENSLSGGFPPAAAYTKPEGIE